MTFSQAFLVFLGAGLGGVARFAMSKYVKVESGFPWATLAINLAACLLLGGLLAWAQPRQALSSGVYLLAATGFCGGFSTFSAFGAEVWQLGSAGQWGAATGYAAASLCGGLACVGLGGWLGKQFFGLAG